MQVAGAHRQREPRLVTDAGDVLEPDAAEPLLETGYTGLKQALGEEDPNTREARRRLARWREARDAGA
ncbi:hypothetical protein ACOPJQ_09655 [Luteimonas dalianensis]|uniref:hypothetical protein n=1 Tax=Luteimonas dalianensis TaxID=1148196 RepID=UPI003BF39A5A